MRVTPPTQNRFDPRRDDDNTELNTRGRKKEKGREKERKKEVCVCVCGGGGDNNQTHRCHWSHGVTVMRTSVDSNVDRRKSETC